MQTIIELRKQYIEISLQIIDGLKQGKTVAELSQLKEKLDDLLQQIRNAESV